MISNRLLFFIFTVNLILLVLLFLYSEYYDTLTKNILYTLLILFNGIFLLIAMYSMYTEYNTMQVQPDNTNMQTPNLMSLILPLIQNNPDVLNQLLKSLK